MIALITSHTQKVTLAQCSRGSYECPLSTDDIIIIVIGSLIFKKRYSLHYQRLKFYCFAGVIASKLFVIL